LRVRAVARCRGVGLSRTRRRHRNAPRRSLHRDGAVPGAALSGARREGDDENGAAAGLRSADRRAARSRRSGRHRGRAVDARGRSGGVASVVTLDTLGPFVYLTVFVLAIVEGEVGYVAAATLVAHGRLNAVDVMVAGASGAAIGDQMYFYALRGRLARWLA